MKKTAKKWKFMKYNGILSRTVKVSDQGDLVFAKGMVPINQNDMGKKCPRNGTDYKCVTIPNICRTARVHRIVCETFHGKAPAGKHYVNHKDEHKNNNAANNVGWVSPSENSLAYFQKHGQKRYSEAKISKVKKLINKGWTNDRIAQSVRMSDSNVSAIKHGHIHHNVLPYTDYQL